MEEDGRPIKFLKLKSIGEWTIIKFLGKGSYGTAFKVRRGNEPNERALKISNDEAYNNSIQWEALVLRKLQQENRGENFVQLYDQGKVSIEYTEKTDMGGEMDSVEKLYYMVVHLVDCEAVDQRIFRAMQQATPRPDQCMCESLKVAMQILKALYDLHSIGILHRDLKPDNLGLLTPPNENLVVLYDLGMARVYTNDAGRLLSPRSFVGMRGTRLWASYNAERGREQGRVDDLWSWFYSLVEWMHRSYYYDVIKVRLPWDFRAKKHRDLLKSPQMPAQVLLRGEVSPAALYRINFHLRMLRPEVCPDYRLLARALLDAHDEITADSARFCPPPPRFHLRDHQKAWEKSLSGKSQRLLMKHKGTRSKKVVRRVEHMEEKLIVSSNSQTSSSGDKTETPPSNATSHTPSSNQFSSADLDTREFNDDDDDEIDLYSVINC